MKTDLGFELIAKEIISGLGFGLAGVFMFSLVDPWDIYYSILFGSVAGYVSMWIGIGVIGYLALKKLGRQSEFIEAISLSFFGIVISIGIYAILVSLTFKLIPYFLSSFVMPIIFPLAGGIVGFNYNLKKSTNIS